MSLEPGLNVKSRRYPMKRHSNCLEEQKSHMEAKISINSFLDEVC